MMDVFSLMFACAVTMLICYLVMRHTLKRRDKLFVEAWTSNDEQAVAQADTYGKIQFVAALVVGALAAGMLFVLIMAFVFSGTAILFTG